ncbi:hypothetical protein PT974_11129 [Cladobotryum mycophilum]|uniref:Uncharacterized protein n=1 Tax=Cladobotryum mycophilum TaxID=491253 RepID=A0ABR0S4D3_9HYPO
MKLTSITKLFVLFASSPISVHASPSEESPPFQNYGEIRVALTTTYQLGWGQQRSSGPLRLFIPKSPNESFRPLGSIALRENGDPNGKRATVIVALNPDKLNKSKPALVPPVGWIRIYFERATQNDEVGFLRAKCPNDYTSIGDVAVQIINNKLPDYSSIWCVRADLTLQGSFPAKPLWDDQSARNKNITVSIWKNQPVQKRIAGQRFLPLDSGTFVTSTSLEEPKISYNRVIVIDLPNNYLKFNAKPPEFTHNNIPSEGDIFEETGIANVTLPLTALFPANDRRIIYHLDNPFCRVSKFAAWIVKGVRVNDGTGDIIYNTTVTIGFSQEAVTTMQEELGMSVSAAAGFKLVSFDLSLNYQLTATNSRSYGKYGHTSSTEHIPIPANQFAVLFGKIIGIKAIYLDGGDLYEDSAVLKNELRVQKRPYINTKRVA